MRAIIGSCLVAVVLCRDGLAESPDPPLENRRLSINTLVREDIFAGWRANDMERFARGEKNIDLLLEQRSKARPDLLAWKGGTKLYRAILAHEAGNAAEFETLYQQTLELFAEAKKLDPQNATVAAVVGGSYVFFGDRLPEKYRAAAWSESYDGYQILWAQQSPLLDKLPLHIRGELLAGLVQASQRTDRKEEFNKYLEKMMEVLPGTPYARVAEEWKKDPQAAATGNISCKSCHAEGRLSARVAALADKQRNADKQRTTEVRIQNSEEGN